MQVCPVCLGRGTMFQIFYEGKSYEVSDFPRMETCRTCHGATVIQDSNQQTVIINLPDSFEEWIAEAPEKENV